MSRKLNLHLKNVQHILLLKPLWAQILDFVRFFFLAGFFRPIVGHRRRALYHSHEAGKLIIGHFFLFIY